MITTTRPEINTTHRPTTISQPRADLSCRPRTHHLTNDVTCRSGLAMNTLIPTGWDQGQQAGGRSNGPQRYSIRVNMLHFSASA